MAQKNSKPVEKVTPKTSARMSDSRVVLSALRKSLRAKQAIGHRVSKITEADKYGDDPA